MCGTNCMTQIQKDVQKTNKNPLKTKVDKSSDKLVSYNIEKFNFWYINRPAMINDHGGCIVVAMSDRPNGSIGFGVSYCSPEDHYDKHKGKDLAIIRCMESFYSVDPRKKTARNINKAILHHILANEKSYPTWAKPILNNLIRKDVVADMMKDQKKINERSKAVQYCPNVPNSFLNFKS